MASGSVSRRAAANDTRRATKEWDPWLVDCNEQDSSSYPRKCKFCGWSKAFVRKRAFSHFGYGGSATSERCKRIPPNVLHKFKNCGGVVPKFMSYEEQYDNPLPSSANDGGDQALFVPETNDHVEAFVSPSNANESWTPNPDSVNSTPAQIGRRSVPSISRQRSIDETLQIGVRQKLDNLWASFFYEANIAFNVVRHPAFVKAVKETAAAGIVYQPPSYNAVRTKMIDVKKAMVKKMVSERTKNSIDQYGATICSDGWSDTNTRPLMNMMLVCPTGDVFLGSVDDMGVKKDIAYTTNMMAQYIEEVGPANIVQLCTDNAAVMAGAMKRLQEKYPHMYRQGCAAHILDLLLEDWGKEKKVGALVDDCRMICKFIHKYEFTLALFRKYSPKKALMLPPMTRFACNFLMVQRLVDCK